MAGGNFDGQAYITGPADSLDQQNTRGRGARNRGLWGQGFQPGSDMFSTPEEQLRKLIRAMMGYGGAQVNS